MTILNHFTCYNAYSQEWPPILSQIPPSMLHIRRILIQQGLEAGMVVGGPVGAVPSE